MNCVTWIRLHGRGKADSNNNTYTYRDSSRGEGHFELDLKCVLSSSCTQQEYIMNSCYSLTILPPPSEFTLNPWLCKLTMISWHYRLSSWGIVIRVSGQEHCGVEERLR